MKLKQYNCIYEQEIKVIHNSTKLSKIAEKHTKTGIVDDLRQTDQFKKLIMREEQVTCQVVLP